MTLNGPIVITCFAMTVYKFMEGTSTNFGGRFWRLLCQKRKTVLKHILLGHFGLYTNLCASCHG